MLALEELTTYPALSQIYIASVWIQSAFPWNGSPIKIAIGLVSKKELLPRSILKFMPNTVSAVKVVDQTGKAMASTQLAAFSEDNQLIDSLSKDQFGYYRGDRPRSGIYRVQLEVVGNKIFKRTHYRLIEIKDGFLFDQYFVISEGRARAAF
jgi:hypothetical protein